MATITFRSPVLKPLLRANQPLPLNRGSVFRVTQQFTSRDFYWNDGRTHQAVDIGDFGCGSPIVAMAVGTAYRVKDNASQIQAGATDALGIRIDHGGGITTEYWHLDAYSVANGANVTAGRQIGIVGDTGLGAVCHCHIEAKRNGVKFDPEPLMFGGSVTTGVSAAPSEEDPMRFGGAALTALEGAPTFRLTAEAHFRPEPNKGGSLKVFPAGTSFRSAYAVRGEAVGTNDEWLETRLYVNAAYQLGYIHSSVAERLELGAPPAGATPDQVAQAERLAFGRGRDQATAAYTAAGSAAAKAVKPA